MFAWAPIIPHPRRSRVNISRPAKFGNREGWHDEPTQLIDVAPTLLEVAGAKYPEREGLPPLRGVSMTPAFEGKPIPRTAPLYSEHEQNGFLIEGDWKLVGRGVAAPNGPKMERWELYNTAEDRTELNNLVETEPERFERMAAAWRQWAHEDQVYPKPGGKKK